VGGRLLLGSDAEDTEGRRTWEGGGDTAFGDISCVKHSDVYLLAESLICAVLGFLASSYHSFSLPAQIPLDFNFSGISILLSSFLSTRPPGPFPNTHLDELLSPHFITPLNSAQSFLAVAAHSEL
jgi:hypothetical protein